MEMRLIKCNKEDNDEEHGIYKKRDHSTWIKYPQVDQE